MFCGSRKAKRVGKIKYFTIMKKSLKKLGLDQLTDMQISEKRMSLLFGGETAVACSSKDCNSLNPDAQVSKIIKVMQDKNPV
jgi:natural product precursor